MKIIRLHVLLKDNTEWKVRLFQQPKEEEAASEAETHLLMRLAACFKPQGE